jgi:hypothetical protein
VEVNCFPSRQRYGSARWEPNREMVRNKVRIRFSKEGELRLISHRDFVRALARAIRRAEIPVKLSEGYKQRPRISFPLASGVGIAGLDEVMEWELARPLSAEMPVGFQCRSIPAARSESD